MFTDEIDVDEMREQTDATETRNASSNSERRDVQPDERPSSMYLPQNAINKGRRSSLTSFAGSSSDGNTPDPEMENSLAYTSKSRRESIKRSKRFLPPDEPNEVHERVSVSADFSGLFRNKLLTAAVNNAEEERKLPKVDTPDSLKMDDTNSTVSSEPSPNMQDVECCYKENVEEEIPLENHTRPSTSQDKEQSLCMEDKTAKSESYLLDMKQVDSYIERAKSTPIEVASICTQTEWSWIEDMKNYEKMKLELQSSQKVKGTTDTNEKAKDINDQESSVKAPNVGVKEKKMLNKRIKDDGTVAHFCNMTGTGSSRCTHCRRQIQPEEKKLNYQDNPYHADCFICEHCRNSLGTDSFVKRDDKRYCQKCFERMFAKTCNTCSDIIKTASVDYESKTYHNECFVCSECRSPLAGKKFHKMGRKLVCKLCYRNKYAKICDYCKQVIEANIKFVVDDEKVYHRECFTCSKCGRPIDGEKYNIKEDSRICLKCPN